MTLASACAETSWRDAPTDVRDRVVDLVADCVAVAALGSARQELQRLVAGHSRVTSEGGASVVGSPRGWPAGTAMFLNGAAVGADQLQDGHRMARGHPASNVVPAVLALAEEQNASVQELLSAVLAGYESGVRVGLAMNGTPPGVHDIGTWGAVAAAAGVARLVAPGDEASCRRAIDLAGSAVMLTDAATFNDFERRPEYFLEIDSVEHVSLGGVYAGVLVGMHWTGPYRARWSVPGARGQIGMDETAAKLQDEVVDAEGRRWGHAKREAWSHAEPRSVFECRLYHNNELLELRDLLSLYLAVMPQLAQFDHDPEDVLPPAVHGDPFGSLPQITVGPREPGVVVLRPFAFTVPGVLTSTPQTVTTRRLEPGTVP